MQDPAHVDTQVKIEEPLVDPSTQRKGIDVLLAQVVGIGQEPEVVADLLGMGHQNGSSLLGQMNRATSHRDFELVAGQAYHVATGLALDGEPIPVALGGLGDDLKSAGLQRRRIGILDVHANLLHRVGVESQPALNRGATHSRRNVQVALCVDPHGVNQRLQVLTANLLLGKDEGDVLTIDAVLETLGHSPDQGVVVVVEAQGAGST